MGGQTGFDNEGGKSVHEGGEAAYEPLVQRYLKLVFGFVLSFAPYSREQAFQITVSSFTGSLRREHGPAVDDLFLETLLTNALAECDRTAPAGVPGISAFGEISASNKGSLPIIRNALIRLSRYDKAVLLLRDQAHLSFERIASILRVEAREARSSCLAARERLRAVVQEILEKPAGQRDGV